MKSLLAILMATHFLTSACLAGPPQPDPYADAIAGHELGAKEAEELEATVTKQADDLSSRTKLLGYYFGIRPKSDEARSKQLGHVLWIIKNHPEAVILGLPYAGINAILDPARHQEVKKLWLEQIEAHPQSAAILGNAAKFLILSDNKLAEEWLKKAANLAPNDPQWPDQLGQLYSLRSEADSAAKALVAFEKAQAAEQEDVFKFYRLDKLAKAAFKAGEFEKASLYANELLKAAARFPKDWNYGNAIHHGNNVLGQIALKQGDLKLASEFLLKAGATSGSPQLDSFGPNMSLAKELLEKDQREPVLLYFELCRKFWEMGGDRLDRWTKEVNAGITPDFGGNLAY